MAHIGKRWKLAPRLDYNINVLTNRNGFANRYYLVLNHATTGFGSLATLFVYELGPPIDTPLGPITWKSGFYPKGPFRFMTSFEVAFDGTGSRYVRFGNLFEESVGLIAKWTIQASFDRLPGFHAEFGDHTVFWDPAWFDSDPFFGVSDVTEKRWTDPAPH